MGLEHVLASAADSTIGQLLTDENRRDREQVTIAGLITEVQRKITKRGDVWAIITVEDIDAAIDVLLFPSNYQLAATILLEDTIVVVKGTLNRDKDQPEIHGREVTQPSLESAAAGPVAITLPSTRCTPPVDRAAQGHGSAPTRAPPRCSSS